MFSLRVILYHLLNCIKFCLYAQHCQVWKNRDSYSAAGEAGIWIITKHTPYHILSPSWEWSECAPQRRWTALAGRYRDLGATLKKWNSLFRPHMLWSPWTSAYVASLLFRKLWMRKSMRYPGKCPHVSWNGGFHRM